MAAMYAAVAVDKYLSKLQHMDNALLGMFCSNMAAEIINLPLSIL